MLNIYVYAEDVKITLEKNMNAEVLNRNKVWNKAGIW